MGQMTPHPGLSRAGLELVKRFEGLRRKAARLDGGGWTIGYGHTVSAREGAEVTADQAEALLIYDLDKVARAVEPLIFAPLDKNQFNALVAFAFNVGLENFRTSAVLKRVNEGAMLQAASAIELWRRADFQGDSLVVDALVRRRAAEKILFLTPPGGFRPAPTPVVRPAYDAAALAQAADLRVPLDGERAFAELGDGQIAQAARNVAERLQTLFPDDEGRGESPAPQPEPQSQPEPPAPIEPEAADPVEEPEPPPVIAAPAAPAPEAPAPRPPFAEAPNVQKLFEAPLVDPRDAEPPAGGFGRRPRGAAADEELPTSSYVVLVVGGVGALMFMGALLAMIYGRATLLNLVIGLVGVVCMAPASLRLLLKLFGERSAND